MQDASKNFKTLKYADGSYTLVDPENLQAMHSSIGAEEEAKVVYADPACVELYLKKDDSEHVLYDVGMGTGANVIAVLARIQTLPSARGKLTIYSFESKPEGLRTALANPSLFPNLIPWKTSLDRLLLRGESKFNIGKATVHWKFLEGDFYTHLEKAAPPDTLFFDFYSPKVVPSLWSLEKFEKLRAHIGDRPALLYSYAAATAVRLNLLAAGFFVGKGGTTSAKLETTIASTRFADLKSPLPRTWLKKLDRSSTIQGEIYARARKAALVNSQWDRIG